MIKSEENKGGIKEEIIEKRFVNTVRKIINLRNVIRVFEEIKSENRQVNMSDEFRMTLPIFDGKDYSTWKKRITIF